MSHDDLIADLIALNGDLDALCTRQTLSGAQRRALADDPQALRALQNWLTLRAHAARLRALSLGLAAAEALLATLATLPSPNDRRRAATTLARLATALSRPPSAPGAAVGRGAPWPGADAEPSARAPAPPTARGQAGQGSQGPDGGVRRPGGPPGRPPALPTRPPPRPDPATLLQARAGSTTPHLRPTG